MLPTLVIYTNVDDPVAVLVGSNGVAVQMWRGDGMRFALEALKPLAIKEKVIQVARLDHKKHPFDDILIDAFMQIPPADPNDNLTEPA